MAAEKIIKLILLFILTAAVLLYWLLPKTRYAEHFQMNERLYLLTGVIGIVSGLSGLIFTLIQPALIIKFHIWELIAVPFVLLYVYWLIIIKINNGRDQWDEKQNLNMSEAAAFSWVVSIPVMVLVFILYQSAVIGGLLWFPIFFFQALLSFSAGTLYFYKNA